MRVLAIASLLLLAGCRFDRDDRPIVDCNSNDDCSAEAPVCLLPANTCVQCTPEEAASCNGATPTCDPATHTCVACSKHADCASEACLPDGTCASEAEIAYVQADGTGTQCTKGAPCPRLSTALGLAPRRPLIKIEAGVITEPITVSLDSDLTIVADPGAALTRSGTILRITARVTIQGLTLSGVNSNPAVQLDDGQLTLIQIKVSGNQGVGVDAKGEVLRIARSIFANNLGGAVRIEGSVKSYELVGNYFVANGTTTMGSSALRIDANLTPQPMRIEFNSFYGNLTSAGGAAVQCNTGGDLVMRNNIVSGTPAKEQQFGGGNCRPEYSIFHQVGDAVLPADNNQFVDPMFVRPSEGDLHLDALSPARRAADPAAILDALSALDIDGDPRTSPADIGADQIR